jgi:hypothetical protein
MDTHHQHHHHRRRDRPGRGPRAAGSRRDASARARHTRFFSLVTTLKKLPADHQAPAGSICPVQKAKEAVGRCCCCATDSPAAGDGSRRGRILLFAARAAPWRGEATGGASVSRNPRRGCAAPPGVPRRAAPCVAVAGLRWFASSSSTTGRSLVAIRRRRR